MRFAFIAFAAILGVGGVSRVQHNLTPIKNIEIGKLTGSGYSPCEPSIAISKRDPNVIVAGAVLDYVMTTSDGGKTWDQTRLKSSMGVFGDPAVFSDAEGSFYYLHLATNRGPNGHLDRIVCQKSTDGGKTWSDGASIGHNPPKQQDKQWAATHPNKPIVAVTWTQFDKYGVKDPAMRSKIMFSLSEDGGTTFSKQIAINKISGDCVDDDTTTEGAVPAIGKDGAISVVWGLNEKLYFDRSADHGKTWMATDQVIGKQVGGWNMEIPGVGRCNGMPVLMIDNSSGKYAGSLYVLFADQRNGAEDTDIFLINSRDNGKTWSQPFRVNKDGAGKQQFFPWLAVDQTTGYLYAVYYDRRAHSDMQTDVYLAYSKDGGKTFTERKISESPFVTSGKGFFGDYNNISASNGVIAPIWTRDDNGRTSVWTAVIRQSDLD